MNLGVFTTKMVCGIVYENEKKKTLPHAITRESTGIMLSKRNCTKNYIQGWEGRSAREGLPCRPEDLRSHPQHPHLKKASSFVLLFSMSSYQM